MTSMTKCKHNPAYLKLITNEYSSIVNKRGVTMAGRQKHLMGGLVKIKLCVIFK